MHFSLWRRLLIQIYLRRFGGKPLPQWPLKLAESIKKSPKVGPLFVTPFASLRLTATGLRPNLIVHFFTYKIIFLIVLILHVPLLKESRYISVSINDK